MPFIYTTATSSCEFREYHKTDNNIHSVKRRVVVRGGANVARRPGNTLLDMYGAPIYTPIATETEVSNDDLAFLEGNKNFKRAKDAGFILVSSKRMPLEKAATDLNAKDRSAPKTPQDYKGRVTVDEKGHTVIGPETSLEEKTARAMAR